MTDQGVRVIAPDFELDFPATGVGMPEHLMVHNVDVFGTSASCHDASGAGIMVTPAVQASAANKSPNPANMVLATGPAMVKIRVKYDIDYMCPNDERLSGTSDFTIFPGGRIVREDKDIQPSTHTLPYIDVCGCQQPSEPSKPLYFSSFWAFDATGATQVPENGISPLANDVYKACTMYDQHAIAVHWEEGHVGTHTRFLSQPTAVHDLDWPNGAGSASDDHYMLAPTKQSITSAIQVWAKPPTNLLECAHILERLEDPPLTVGTTHMDSSGYDGIYRNDSAIHSDKFDVIAGDNSVPAGFAIAVNLGGASHAVVTRSDGSQHVALLQPDEGNRFVIVFSEGLMAHESLSIEPRS